jgi:uncharacterized protein (DUF1330 family)
MHSGGYHELRKNRGYPDYAQRVPATVSLHGGKLLVRPGKSATLTRRRTKKGFAVLAFDNVEQARKWVSLIALTAR